MPSEMMISYHITTRCQSPEDRDLYLRWREQVKILPVNYV